MEFSWSAFVWEGRPALLYFVSDVTEWKKMEQALKESEAKYKELAESITDVFFAMDSKLRYTYWNRASEELTGIPAKDALGKRVYDIFPDDEATGRALNAYRSVLATREPQHFVNEYSLGGRDYVFDISAYPTTDGLCVYIKDVTERRKLQKALDESEQWYRHLFDNAPFGIGFASIDGKVITMNKAMEIITGYSAEEFSKINLADTYVNKADREALLQEIRRHGGVTDYPVQLRRKDGTAYDAMITSRLTNIGDREFVQTILNDVTERKRAEEALRESEQRYRFLVELSPEAIFVASEGKHVFVNSAGLKLFGASSPDQIIGKPVMDVIHQDYREVVAQRMKKSMETGVIALAAEEKFLRLDGTEIDVEARAAPLIYQGKPAIQAVVRDISERKQAEEELRLSEQNFRDSIENSPLGIRIVSENGEMLYANRALLAIYGYSSLEELAAAPSKQRYTPQGYVEHKERVKKRKLGEYVPPYYEISIVRKDGQVRHLAVSRGEVLWDGERQFQVVYQDITERKAREEEYQAIIRATVDGFWQADMQGHFLDVNESYCNLMGYSRDELLNMSIMDVEATETAEETAERIQKVGKVGYDRFESRHRRKDGETVDVEISVNYLPIDGGRMVVFIRDITERKRAEEALRQGEEHFRALIENSSDVVTIVDSLGTVKYQSPNYKAVWGRDPIGELGRDMFKDIHPDDLAIVGERFNYLLTNPDSSAHIEARAQHEDGSWRTIDVVGRNLLDHPAVLGIVVNFRDITERKRAEEALRASETRYRLLAENVRDVIWAMDMDLRFTYVSPSVQYLGDRTAEEVMSMSLGQLLTLSSQELAMGVFAEELAIANTTPQDPGRSRTLEVEFIRRDGSTIWAELRMSFMRDSAGRPVGILGVMRDITERKKAEEERREFEQKAQLASHLASVGELSAGVAHEINNPLTGVIGYAELLMQEDVPKNVRDDLKIIHDGAKRVADIVKGLLTFARQSKPERIIVDINQVIEVVLRLRAYELRTNNIKVTTNLAPDLPLTVADPSQLQQVFLNLIINAEMEMKLAHGKGKLIIKAEQVDNDIRISFKDDGPGIAEENLVRIFDPFFTTREAGKGTGLGLSICHGIVTEHGGRIYAESKLGKGGTFTVELPIVDEKRRPKQAKPASKQKKVTGAKILVVDDEPVVRRLLSHVLTEEGHEVEATDDGEDALNRIKGNKYSLILLDMKLPGMSGSQLYKRIQEIESSLAKRVVFITGDVMGADTEAILARTGVPCITKPFDVKQLSVEITRLLAIHHPKPARQVKSQKAKAKS
jgi:PAS domain S-box-containing protein